MFTLFSNTLFRRPLFRRPFAAATVAVGLATAGLMPAPAVADGQIAIRILPRTADEAAGIRLALALYGMRQDIRSGAGITQRGLGNLAQLGQPASGNLGGNFGVIDQRGTDHQGTLQQQGRRNAFGLFQSGRGTVATVRQMGNGQTGLLFVRGW